MNLAQVLRQVRLLELRSRHLVRDLLAGGYSSVFKGRGMEFAEVREYQPGDDVKTIDWNVTARLGSAYVKRYVEERELTVLFVLDASASTLFGTRLRTKAELAAEASAILALSAARNNDRVGAILFTDHVERFIPPRKGTEHVFRVIAELIAFSPRGRGTDLVAALRFLDRVQRRRTLVFLVSDFLTSGYEPMLKAIARRHEVIALQLRDARERDLPAVGLLRLRDLETGQSRYVDSTRRKVRNDFQDRIVRFDQALAASLRHHAVDLVPLETGRSTVEPLLAFFRRREELQRR